MSRHPIVDNPFYVLEVRPGASEVEIERAGQKWLAMLTVGIEAAKTYPSPAGPRPRDADRVRQAIGALRDREARPLHELWAQLAPEELPTVELPSSPWPEALAALGRRQSRGSGSGTSV